MADAKKKKNSVSPKNRRAEKGKKIFFHLTMGIFTSTCLNLE